MDEQTMTDREVYPALWALLGALGLAYLVWRYALGAPAISRCWIWEHWGVYCPGCGGTRALIALAQGHLLASLYYHPALPVLSVWGVVYLSSQTLWRLRGRKGWALRYRAWWPYSIIALLLVNCAVRNVLWLGYGIPL